MKNKILSVVLVLVLIFSTNMAVTKVISAASPMILLEEKEAGPGDDVSIIVMLENNPGLWGMDLRISYDKTAMTLTSVENGTFFRDSEWTSGNLNADVYVLSYEAGDLADITKTSGTLATLNFKIKDDAEPGTYTISASYNPGDIINIGFDDINFGISNGNITVAGKTDLSLGDTDGSGSVDAADLTKLARHVAKIEMLSGEGLANADVDKDGDIDAADLTMLARYVAKIITHF